MLQKVIDMVDDCVKAIEWRPLDRFAIPGYRYFIAYGKNGEELAYVSCKESGEFNSSTRMVSK